MYRCFLKRVFDVVLSVLGIPFVVLLTIILGPLIFFTDKGPIFYCSKRIGRNGVIFTMIKFRSMKVNSPDIRTETDDCYNSEDDPRVTWIGKILRKTSIDELPQLFNVFIGNMSLIGPRPDPVDWLEKYTDEERYFLTVKPGITGYSQAFFRNSIQAKEKIQNDVFYARNLSFPLDFKIFIQTIKCVFRRDNIYRN